MSLGRLDFDEISETDLRSLIDAGVSEGIAIDYKAALYGRSDGDVKEFLKDASSFANTAGGHLVIGMVEKDGVASEIAPIASSSIDDALQRLENLVRDGIEPRVVGTRIRAIPIAGGGSVIVIRVPRSWNPPHRVSARNTNRFYARNSAGAHEVSVEELRVLFNVSATAQDRIRAFRAERFAKITTGETPAPLANERGRIILHLVPFSAFSAGSQVDLKRAYELRSGLQPIGAPTGYGARYNFDGLIVVRPGERSYGYTQLFRNGAIEATKVGLLMETQRGLVIPSADLDRDVIEALVRYLDSLKALEIPPPVAALLTLDGVRGAALGVKRDMFSDPPDPINQAVLELPEILIEDYGSPENYQRAARPAFDALWNAGGFAGSRHFDEEGVWRPPQ